MAEPDNHTIRLLREIRAVLDGMNDKIDHNYTDLRERLENLRKASFGESILGRYATAEVDDLEKRVSALEGADNSST